MCDMWKTSVSNWQRYCFTIGKKKHCKKTTVTMMVNDCTTISIYDMSAVFKYYVAIIIYHYDYSTDCYLSLRVVEHFYTSQSLGSIDFHHPPKWRPCPGGTIVSSLAVNTRSWNSDECATSWERITASLWPLPYLTIDFSWKCSGWLEKMMDYNQGCGVLVFL